MRSDAEIENKVCKATSRNEEFEILAELLLDIRRLLNGQPTEKA